MPRRMIPAPFCLAYSTSSPPNVSTATLGIPRVASCSISTRSMTVKSGSLSGFVKTATIKLPKTRRARSRLFAMDRIWIMDRNYPGAARIAWLTARTHVLIRLKSDIPVKGSARSSPTARISRRSPVTALP